MVSIFRNIRHMLNKNVVLLLPVVVIIIFFQNTYAKSKTKSLSKASPGVSKDKCESYQPQPDDIVYSSYLIKEQTSLWKRGGYHWSQVKSKSTGPSVDSLKKKLRDRTDQDLKVAVLKDDVELLIHTWPDGTLITQTYNDRLEEAQAIQDSVKNNTKINYDKISKRSYFCASFIDKDGKIKRGWVEMDVVTPPAVDEEVAKKYKDCGGQPQEANKTDIAKALQKSTKNESELGIPEKKSFQSTIKKATQPENKVDGNSFEKLKSNDEIEEFACLYRSSEITKDEFCSEFGGSKGIFNYAKKAAESFDLPYAVVMCTLLTESAGYPTRCSPVGACGYGQFMPAAASDLEDNIATGRHSYLKNGWKEYQSKIGYSGTFSTDKLRSDSKEVGVAGIAAQMKWLLTNRVALSGCKDCTTISNNNVQHDDLKSIYLALSGYNWSPYQLGRISKKSLSQLKSSYPPPRETRGYLTAITNCMNKGVVNKFRPFKGVNIDSPQYQSGEYKRRKNECPIKCS